MKIINEHASFILSGESGLRHLYVVLRIMYDQTISEFVINGRIRRATVFI